MEEVMKRLDRIERIQEEQLNEQVEIKHRLGTIERIEIAVNVGHVKEDIGSTLGNSFTKAAIVSLCKEEKSNNDLMEELGLSASALSNHTSVLVRGDILTPIKRGREKYFQRIPMLDKINFEAQYADLIQRFWDSRDEHNGG